MFYEFISSYDHIDVGQTNVHLSVYYIANGDNGEDHFVKYTKVEGLFM